MSDRFRQQKEAALRKYAQAKENGLVDEALVEFLGDVNALSDFYTTSSCAGRIVLLQDVGHKRDDHWLGKWHQRVSEEDIRKALVPVTGTVWFIQEPFILHLVCRSQTQAKRAIDLAIESGFKRTGIISFDDDRFVVEVLSTERIAAPIQQDGTLLVDDDYVTFLTELANQRFKRGQQKAKRFMEGFRKTFIDDPQSR